MHYIYKITIITNNKIYIGQTKDVSKRWYRHRKEAQKDKPSMIVNRAMKKHGVENCKIEVIDFAQNYWQADCLEQNWIKRLESHISLGKGYNISMGGPVAPKSDEWKQHMSDLMQGKHHSPETEFQHGHARLPGSGAPKGTPIWNKGITGEESHSFGVVFTDERKQRIREKAIQNNFGDRVVKAGVKTRFQPKLTSEQWNEIETLVSHGGNQTHIAKRYGISRGAIYSHLQRLKTAA